jgi:hypothetical protein
MVGHFLSFPQPLPLNIAGVTAISLFIGLEQCSTGLAAPLTE